MTGKKCIVTVSLSFTKRLVRLRSVFSRCEDDGLCGYSAAAEGHRRFLFVLKSQVKKFSSSITEGHKLSLTT